MGYKNKTGLEYQREYYLKIKDKRKTEEYKQYQREYYLKYREEILYK